MKELEKIKSQTVQEAVDISEDQRKKHIQTFDLKPNHSLWEINVNNGTITKAKFKNVSVPFTSVEESKNSRRIEVDQKENCVYIVALNKKNAERKLIKSL